MTPRRADAQRNREKILVAARETFAECGLPAQMEDIAGRAGVGVGTLYRHFPTKDALLSELVRDHFDRFAERGRAALADGGDPWEVLSAHLWACAEQNREDRALAQVLASQPAFGEVLEEGDAVALVVASGSSIVPRVLGAGRDEASIAATTAPSRWGGRGRCRAAGPRSRAADAGPG